MDRKWWISLAVVLGIALTGCAGRPAPRPEARTQIPPQTHRAVTQTVLTLGLTRSATAVVAENNVALVGLEVTGPGMNKSMQGSTGQVGGGISPGLQTPGSSPNSTQAAPGGQMDLATQNGTSNSPASGSNGDSKLDVMKQVADRVRAAHPFIREVRFVTDPHDITRLARVSSELERGVSPGALKSDLDYLVSHSWPAGTTVFPVTDPPQGAR